VVVPNARVQAVNAYSKVTQTANAPTSLSSYQLAGTAPKAAPMPGWVSSGSFIELVPGERAISVMTLQLLLFGSLLLRNGRWLSTSGATSGRPPSSTSPARPR